MTSYFCTDKIRSEAFTALVVEPHKNLTAFSDALRQQQTVRAFIAFYSLLNHLQPHFPYARRSDPIHIFISLWTIFK